MLKFFVFLNERMNNFFPFNNFSFPPFYDLPVLFWHPFLLSIFRKSISPPLKNWKRLLWKGWEFSFFVRPIKKRNLTKCTSNCPKQELPLMLPLRYCIMLKLGWDFLYIFLNSYCLISLFSSIVYLIRFNTYNKRHFPKYMLTCVSNFTSYIWNLFNSTFPFLIFPSLLKEDDTAINNGDSTTSDW